MINPDSRCLPRKPDVRRSQQPGDHEGLAEQHQLSDAQHQSQGRDSPPRGDAERLGLRSTVLSIGLRLGRSRAHEVDGR